MEKEKISNSNALELIRAIKQEEEKLPVLINSLTILDESNDINEIKSAIKITDLPLYGSKGCPVLQYYKPISKIIAYED